MEISKKDLETTNTTIVSIGNQKNEKTGKVAGNIELDIENQTVFTETINTIFESKKSNIILDMSLISYIDSSGLWALFEGHKKAEKQNSHLVLINPTKDVQRVLNITKMSSKMKVVTNQKEAIRFLETK